MSWSMNPMCWFAGHRFRLVIPGPNDSYLRCVICGKVRR